MNRLTAMILGFSSAFYVILSIISLNISHYYTSSTSYSTDIKTFSEIRLTYSILDGEYISNYSPYSSQVYIDSDMTDFLKLLSKLRIGLILILSSFCLSFALVFLLHLKELNQSTRMLINGLGFVTCGASAIYYFVLQIQVIINSFTLKSGFLSSYKLETNTLSTIIDYLLSHFFIAAAIWMGTLYQTYKEDQLPLNSVQTV